ncbi:MAG TPA: hypothetical protein VJQ82_07280 [Terriglobales bacterium]|nr:hypothetical protein [Terriglobales bacterium]
MTNDLAVPSSFGRAVWTVLWIGLIAGTLDISDALIYSAIRGATPKMVFQYIASGLVGMQSFQMGGASVVLGAAIHYAIALTWTAIFYIASRQIAVLRERPVISGIAYGAVVYVVMNYVVLPLTRVPPAKRPPTVAGRINAVAALLFCIGLTVSLLVKWSDSRSVVR